MVDLEKNRDMLRWMVLSIERVVGLLDQSERGEAFPDEFRDKRYIVLHGVDPEVMRDPPEEDDPFYERAKEWIGLRVAGEALDLEAALRLLWESISTLQEQFSEDVSTDEPWQTELKRCLEDGPWSVPEDQIAAAVEFGVSLAKEKYPKSRVEFAFYGDAPYEGESAAILELPLKTELTGKNKNLLIASRKNELDRVQALIKKGADVRAMDAHADTALHFAVANRNREMVEVLLEAGADPNLGARFGHSPIFAKKATRGHTVPETEEFDDENHFAMVCRLIERGADVHAMRPHGQTLVDVAMHGLPMNERWVRHFLGLGVSSRLLRTAGYRRPFDKLLGSLHYFLPEERARIPNSIRVLGWLGCDPNETENGLIKETPVEAWLTTGYSAEEVEPEVIAGIAQAFVDIGARDDMGLSDSRRPSGRAEDWSKQKGMKHYAEAARILREGRGE